MGFNNNRIKGGDSAGKIIFKPSPPPPMLSADVRSKVLVLLLLIQYLLLLPLFVRVLCLVLVCNAGLSSFAVTLLRKRDLVALLSLCFSCHVAFIVLCLSTRCHGLVYVVCDCGILVILTSGLQI